VGFGKLNGSLYAPKGWELRLAGEATFRDDWHRWGPANLYDSPSNYQRATIEVANVFSTFDDQHLSARIMGGMGNGIDRLSGFRLGGSLDGKAHSLMIHGFYSHELIAEDFGLLSLDYTLPLHKDYQCALHFYSDLAATARSDIADRSTHIWSGLGSGVSFRGYWDTDWLVGYGYGINAQRRTDHGSHEIFAQLSKKF
jgi:hypothetical protein